MKKKSDVSDRISRFQDIVDRGAVCVTGSGRCATHNKKLVHEVISKKQSCVDKSGGIEWRFSDFTILICPTKLSTAPGRADKDVSTMISQIREG